MSGVLSYEFTQITQEIQMRYPKYMAAKKQLEVFMNSAEGQKKINTTADEQSIKHFSGMLEQQHEKFESKKNYYNKVLEEARAKFEEERKKLEKTERSVQESLFNLQNKYNTDTVYAREKLEAAKSRLEFKTNSAKPKELLRIEQTMNDELAAIQRLQKRATELQHTPFVKPQDQT